MKPGEPVLVKAVFVKHVDGHICVVRLPGGTMYRAPLESLALLEVPYQQPSVEAQGGKSE